MGCAPSTQQAEEGRDYELVRDSVMTKDAKEAVEEGRDGVQVVLSKVGSRRHNCFNPLSLFELCFPIDWRLLVDWDISNIG